MSKGGVRGLARYQLQVLMTSRFYNPEWYSKHPPHPFMLDVEENRTVKDFLLLDVLDFCMKTDVCKQLNISFMELMQLDLATYTTIKESIRKDNEQKARIIEQQQRDLDNRQKQFGGIVNHVPRQHR